jgi:hypothetical protein
MLTLVGRSLRRIAWIVAALAAVLATFQYTLVAVAASYERAGSFTQLAALVPDFAAEHLGAALTSFAAMTTGGYFEPLVVMIVAQFAIHVAAEPAAEIELGLVDTVLARPLPRRVLVTRSLLVMAVAMLALMIAMGAATALGLRVLAPPQSRWPEPRHVLVLMANLVMVSLCFGAATLAAAGWARRRVSAQGPVAISAVAFYLVHLVAGWWAPARLFARVSPFRYFAGAAILNGRANTALDFSVLGAATVVASAVAYWQFGRRDL